MVGTANGGTGVANTATLTLGSSNQNWATLGTGIVKNTTTTGAITNATSGDILGLCTTCVVSSSPGVGIAHFAGSTQTVTSSAVNLAGADVTGSLPAASVAAGVLADGMTATTQTSYSADAKLATNAYVNTQTTPIYSLAQTGISLTAGTGVLTTLSGSGCSSGVCTMVTPAADTTYKITFQTILTTAGSGGTCTTGGIRVELNYKDPDSNTTYSAVPAFTYLAANTAATATSMAFQGAAVGAGQNYQTFYREFRAKASTAVSYQVDQTGASNCSTPPVFTIRPALYALGY